MAWSDVVGQPRAMRARRARWVAWACATMLALGLAGCPMGTRHASHGVTSRLETAAGRTLVVIGNRFVELAFDPARFEFGESVSIFRKRIRTRNMRIDCAGQKEIEQFLLHLSDAMGLAVAIVRPLES